MKNASYSTDLIKRLSLAASVAAFPFALSLLALLVFYPMHWLNEPVHSSIESAGALIALILGFLMLGARDYAPGRRQHYIWIANSMICSGTLDAFHALLRVSASFFWTRALSTFIGGLVFSLVCLKSSKKEVTFTHISSWVLGSLSLVLGIYLTLFPEAFPHAFDQAGDFSSFAKSVNVLGGLGYCFAGVYFFRRYREGGLAEDLTFLAQCSFLAVAGLLFSLSKMWDMTWWLFHFLRFFSYLIVLRNVFSFFRKMQNEVISTNLTLEGRVRQLAESTSALEAANLELESFSYSISHDLRSPLRGIHGFSEALVQDYGATLDEQAKKYLGFIQDGVKKMGALIDDILSLSRINRIDLRRVPMDLSAAARKIVENLKSEKAGSEFEVVIQPGINLFCDAGLTGIILENLLANAWKFSGKNPRPRIEVGMRQDGKQPVVFIKDNGAGFSMEYYEKLFGVFQRLHSDKEFPGTGIGLATVKRAVHRHGGRVWAESKPNQGATFYFTVGN